MHSSERQGETAQQLGNTEQRHTYMMSVAQLQQHSIGGDAGGPEEAPLVARATLPFLACALPITLSHVGASHRGVASSHTKSLTALTY